MTWRPWVLVAALVLPAVLWAASNLVLIDQARGIIRFKPGDGPLYNGEIGRGLDGKLKFFQEGTSYDFGTGSGGSITITPGANVTVNGGTDPVTGTSFTIASTGGSSGASGPTTGVYQNLIVLADTITVTVTADGLTLSSASADPIWTSGVTQTASLAASGAGGLDTGSEASSTWYAVHVIGKTDGTVAALLSLSPSAPVLPSGYTHFRRVAWLKNDGSSNNIPYLQVGALQRYRVDMNGTSTQVLNAGTSSSAADVDCSAYVPPGVRMCALFSYFGWQATQKAAAWTIFDKESGNAVDTIYPGIQTYGWRWMFQQIPLTPARVCQYSIQAGEAPCSLNVAGYRDPL